MGQGREKINLEKVNAFIAAGQNRLQPVEIAFDHRIRQIKPLASLPTDWKKSGLPLAIPGAVDAHVHFNTPGFEHRDDFGHASAAAAHGGVTTVVDMPCTSLPPVTSAKNLEIKKRAIQGLSHVDYALWGGISGNLFHPRRDPADIRQHILDMADAGVVGFKAYLLSGMETFAHLSPEQMMRAAQWVRETGLPLAVHAEDRDRVNRHHQALQRAGTYDWRAYCEARDDRAEAAAIETMLHIARQTRCPVHIVHLSSRRGLGLVRRAREEGLVFTAETCPHYLFFTRDDFNNPAISAYLKTAPPVKSADDRRALWDALKDGTIDFVTTDHAGCDPKKEKNADDFRRVYGGIPGVEHRVPFLFSEGFKKGRLTLARTIELLCTNPADFCGLGEKKGKLRTGMDADMTLIDLRDHRTVRAREMHCKGKYTPFEGVTFNAVVNTVYLRGNRVMDQNTGARALPKGTFITAGKRKQKK